MQNETKHSVRGLSIGVLAALVFNPFTMARPLGTFKIIALALAISAVAATAQTMTFFRQFTTPGMDRAAGVAADASGIYVIGSRPSHQGGPGSAGLRKYDARGNELWTREFGVSAHGSAATDATSVYVLGVTPVGVNVLRRFSAEGNELWTRQLEFPPLGGLAADVTGVYVAGGNYTSAYVRKYGPDGAELWTSRFGEIKTASGLAVDATGVYAQVTNSNGAAGVSVRKWDTRGNDLWTRELNPSDVQRAFAAAVPTGFYVLVAAGADGWVPTLRKYDSGGNELWSRQHVGPDGDPLVWIAADATGVYVAGRQQNPFIAGLVFGNLPRQCRSGSGGDSFLRKYDLDGAEVWARQFGTANAVWASGVAVDATGVYVVGDEGTVQARDAQELFTVFAPANPVSGAFLAKFEKTAAAPPAPGPRIFPDCVVNAASYVGGGVAPGEIVTLFGSAMGPTELVGRRLTEDLRLANTLGDTRILFNGVPAPLLYVSDKQSSAIVPYALAGRPSVDVQVEYRGVLSDPVTVPVLASRPGIFSLDGTGQGQGAILNEDGTVNSPSNPAQRDSIITFFGTGGGEAASGVADGEIVSGVVPRTSLPVSVFFARGLYEDWGQGEVLYAGGSRGSVAGLLQVNVRVPANAGTGERVPFAFLIGSHWTVHQITIALR